MSFFFFFFQAEDGIRDVAVTGVQTCALPILVIVATSDLNALPEVAHRIVWMEDGAVRRIGDPALLAENALCEAGLATTVADVWRTARLGAPYPLTVAQAEERWRQ